MNETNFIKVPKELFHSAIYEDKELFHFCLTLLELARFTPTKIDDIDIMAGQLLTTGTFLCERCRITRGKLRSYLKTLTDSGFISRESINHKYTLITINRNSQPPKTVNVIRF